MTGGSAANKTEAARIQAIKATPNPGRLMRKTLRKEHFAVQGQEAGEKKVRSVVKEEFTRRDRGAGAAGKRLVRGGTGFYYNIMSHGQSSALYKADLHVHTRYSGRAKHLRFLHCRDCYSDPLDVYRTAKQRGMDLVTITDHDSIDGCLELLHKLGELPDFVIGEEVSAVFPEFRHTVHIGVYGINEAQHREIQRRRADGEELVSYLRRHQVVFSLHHFFHDFSNPGRLREFIERMAQLFNVFEVRNGALQREHNTFIVALLERFRRHGRAPGPLGMTGGSDAHTLRRIGRTYTASPAHTREEFLEDIRTGRTQVFGPHSNHLSLAADIYGVVLRYYPAVLSVRNGEFPPLVRLKNFLLSLAITPFLVTPYLVAVRHTRSERQRINLFSRLFLGNPISSAPASFQIS